MQCSVPASKSPIAWQILFGHLGGANRGFGVSIPDSSHPKYVFRGKFVLQHSCLAQRLFGRHFSAQGLAASAQEHDLHITFLTSSSKVVNNGMLREILGSRKIRRLTTYSIHGQLQQNILPSLTRVSPLIATNLFCGCEGRCPWTTTACRHKRATEWVSAATTMLQGANNSRKSSKVHFSC